MKEREKNVMSKTNTSTVKHENMHLITKVRSICKIVQIVKHLYPIGQFNSCVKIKFLY